MRTGLPRASNATRNASNRAATFSNLSWLLPAWSLRLYGASGPAVMQGHASPWRSLAGWRSAYWPFPSPSNKAAALRRDPSTGKRARFASSPAPESYHPGAMEALTGIRHANGTLHEFVAINFRGTGFLGPNPCRKPNGLRFPGDERSPPSGQGENPGCPRLPSPAILLFI